ncbi:hypothetical protein HDU76_009750 [Blyttiomyces sp. JEL0837]|nr:hypothetical protein HDU76_009750 [Blyttiomyces sp. JEL0837]
MLQLDDDQNGTTSRAVHTQPASMTPSKSPHQNNNPTPSKVKVSLTLNLMCPICQTKVRDPVLCKNRHIFCDCCISEWLKRKAECPSCRIPITSAEPFLPVIAGNIDEVPALQNGQRESPKSRSTTRRTRVELALLEYDKEIEQYEREILRLQERCAFLEKQEQDRQTKNKSNSSPRTPSSARTMEVDEPDNPFIDNNSASRQNTPSNKRQRVSWTPSQPKGMVQNFKNDITDAKKDLNDTNNSSSKSTEIECLLAEVESLIHQNQSFKTTIDEQRSENLALRMKLDRANTRLTQMPAFSQVQASPSKSGGILSLRIRIEQLEKENAGLHSALLKSDEYIEQLQEQLRSRQDTTPAPMIGVSSQ